MTGRIFMGISVLHQRLWLTGFGLALVSAGVQAQTQSASAPSPARNDAPNFVLIYAEERGWVSSSVQMDDSDPLSRSTFLRTPNLERLAAEGMRFSRGYAPSPRCTPSRAALVTGKSPARLHMTYVSASGGELRDGELVNGGKRTLVPPPVIVELPEAELTIAEMLQQSGYATAHFGKWHLGRRDPKQHGFDESDGPNNNNAPNGDREANPKEMFRTAELGVDFITRQVREGRPFFLQISHYPERINRGDQGAMIAAVRNMDTAIGQLLDAVDELGVADNTYVIYTADHGVAGQNNNAPLSRGKGWVQEGGLRVPFIVAGPNVKQQAVSHIPVTAMDIFPTIAELTDNTSRIATDVEGGSLVPVLRDGTTAVERSREEIVFHFPHYDLGNEGPATALLLGKYKLIKTYETGSLRLFDLDADPGEQHDLAADMPERTKDLDQRLMNYLREVGAQMPRRNE